MLANERMNIQQRAHEFCQLIQVILTCSITEGVGWVRVRLDKEPIYTGGNSGSRQNREILTVAACGNCSYGVGPAPAKALAG